MKGLCWMKIGVCFFMASLCSGSLWAGADTRNALTFEACRRVLETEKENRQQWIELKDQMSKEILGIYNDFIYPDLDQGLESLTGHRSWEIIRGLILGMPKEYSLWEYYLIFEQVTQQITFDFLERFRAKQNRPSHLLNELYTCLNVEGDYLNLNCPLVSEISIAFFYFLEARSEYLDKIQSPYKYTSRLDLIRFEEFIRSGQLRSRLGVLVNLMND